ncbi:MAG TPA: hypothetical protein VKX40_14015 [Aequorivita sp.]|nr:hypothetical protein [Aequorivita sp.]
MTGLLLINLLELLAFVIAVYYYQKKKSKPNYYLAWFLGITFLVEILSWYTYYTDTGFLHFLKGTYFETNYWLGNMYSLYSYLFYINYFKWFLVSKSSRLLLNRASIFFLIFGIGEILLSKGFFVRAMPFSDVLGTLLIFLSIGIYYLELLKSDQILLVHKTLPFYVSVGALIFHLTTTPFFIYSSYYSESIDPGFVDLYRQVIFGANYLLYSIYIAGFLICLRTKTPYFHNRSY